MTNYQYIEDLFEAILTSSTAIEGRFFTGSRYGLQEINYDLLGQVLSGITLDKKYPLVVMAPPHSTMNPAEKRQGWEEFRIILFFMKQTYSNQNLNPKTKTSLHTVQQDWHDMKRCAVNFIRALTSVQVHQPPPHMFFLPPNQILYIPMSNIGVDLASGMRMDFDFRLRVDPCLTEDYDPEYPEQVAVSLDSHPEHQL